MYTALKAVCGWHHYKGAAWSSEVFSRASPYSTWACHLYIIVQSHTNDNVELAVKSNHNADSGVPTVQGQVECYCVVLLLPIAVQNLA